MESRDIWLQCEDARDKLGFKIFPMAKCLGLNSRPWLPKDQDIQRIFEAELNCMDVLSAVLHLILQIKQH